MSPNKLLNTFAPDIEVSNPKQHHLKYKSIVLSMNKYYQRSLMGDALYSQRVEEGLAITLLRNHTARESEALLAEFIEDQAEARTILQKVRGLIHATA